MEDKKLLLLIEHYNESFKLLQDKLKERNRIFVYLLFVLGIILFQIYTPQEALNMVSQFISQRMGLSAQIDLLFIESIIWFILLAVTLRYFQIVVYIERQYKYIHKLENEIKPSFNHQAFTREGLSYLKIYPRFLNWVYFLYAVFFPILLVFIIISKIICEFIILGTNSALIWFNCLICLFIIITTILYFMVMHIKKE